MNDLVSKMPCMLSGKALDKALQIFPEYKENIVNEDSAKRLIALSDIYNVLVPNQMGREIYSKVYLAMLRSLQKKEGIMRVRQAMENHKAATGQKAAGGIIGGADSFTIIGKSGVGKTTAVKRAIDLICATPIIEMENPYSRILPCVCVQCPFDSSPKGLLLEIIRVIDSQLGTNYYPKSNSARSTTDYLIGMVSNICLNHVGVLIVDEIQNIAVSKNGRNLFGVLLQMINCCGISVIMVGTPECENFFSAEQQLARRSVGLRYGFMEYGEEFKNTCSILFRYCYTKQCVPLDETLLHWLYEHTNGSVSSVVALIHDAQEIAILDGREVLSLETLLAAYNNRLKMLHSFITPTTLPQTGKKRENKTVIPSKDNEGIDDFSVLDVAMKAKKNGEDILNTLKAFIKVEEIRI